MTDREGGDREHFKKERYLPTSTQSVKQKITTGLQYEKFPPETQETRRNVYSRKRVNMGKLCLISDLRLDSMIPVMNSRNYVKNRRPTPQLAEGIVRPLFPLRRSAGDVHKSRNVFIPPGRVPDVVLCTFRTLGHSLDRVFFSARLSVACAASPYPAMILRERRNMKFVLKLETREPMMSVFG